MIFVTIGALEYRPTDPSLEATSAKPFKSDEISAQREDDAETYKNVR